MKIAIKVKDGKNICCNSISSESVKELKTRIQEKEKILVQQYNIIFNGENLNDECLLSDYSIQDDSVLLLVNKEKSLLLKSSIIFDNSDLIDRIHQSIIDLKKDPRVDEVLDLLNEAISYLDEDLKTNIAIELFSLIKSCSLQCLDQSLELFNKRLQRGKISSNHIISFAKVLSNISMNFPQISIKYYDDFISNSFQQISQQILKSPDNNLIILGNEIPPQFKNSFIADIILLFNPTEQIVENFSPYIINPKIDFDIINFFIKKVNDSGLLNLIPDSLLIKSSIYNFLTVESIELKIQSSTKQTFRKFIPLIKNSFKKFHLTPSYCNTILNKLIEYDILLSSEFNEILFQKVDDIELDLKNLEYLKRHKIKLPDKFISKIESLPISTENIELFYHPEKMPKDHLTNVLYNANELKIYYILLDSKYLMTDAFTKVDFWKHILTIVSSTNDEINDNIISRFSFYFQLNSPAQKEKIFDGLIFDEHFPNEKQSNFLLKIFIQLYGDNYDRCLFINKPERFTKLFSYNEIPSKSLCRLFLYPDNFLTRNPTPKDKQIPFKVFHKLMSYSNYNDIEYCLYQCLNNPEFENKHSNLIKLLLQNKSIVYKYIVASIERLYPNMYTKRYSVMFDAKHYLCDQFQDDIRFILKHLYAYNPKQFNFIKKLNVKQPELPDIDYTIIDKLIQLKNYRSFDCLHYIASCFPFLFENDIFKIIDLVLPTLNCLSFIYDETIEIDDLKIAISALSFLYSCLQSTKFISTFIVWLFENIEYLTESQIVCMSRILIALYETYSIDKIICGYALKYNVFDKVNNLLKKDIANEKFKIFYFNNLYQLINIHVNEIFLISDSKYDYVLINQISNGSLLNPFDTQFNFYSVIPMHFTNISFSFPNKNESTELIDKFIHHINDNIIYRLSHIQNYKFKYKNSNFSINNEDQQYDFIYENLPQIKPSSAKILSYLILQPKWAFNLLTGKDSFPILPEHYSILNEIKKNAPIDDENDNDEESPIIDFQNIDSCDKLIKSILKDYLYSEITYNESYLQLISLLTKYKCNNEFFELLIDILLEIETPPTFKLFYTNLCDLLYSLMDDDVDSNVKKKFFEKIGTKLINYFLSPYLIDNSFHTSKFLIFLNCNLPIQTMHIIEYLMACDPSNITLSIELYSKIEKGKATCLFTSITNIFFEEMEKPDLDYNTVSQFLKKCIEQNLNDQLKQLMKKNASLCADCLSTCIHKYMNSKDQILGDFIIDMFNILAPERNNNQVEYSEVSDEIDFTLSSEIKTDDEDDFYYFNDKYLCLSQATESIYYNDINFWQNIYEKHRSFLCFFSDINDNNFEKLTFLHDYYELVPFYYRLSYFKKKTSQLLNRNEFNRILIRVSRSNILEDTFNQLNFVDPKLLIGEIRVLFKGENGIDEGGLTSEWFSLIFQELLNLKYGLFISNENNCYHPNQLSYINSNHIDYFKLAGKIIALALLNDQNINVHLSIALYRQILHKKIKFKDIENFDHSLYNSLDSILNIDDVKDLDLVFSIDDEVFGKITSIDLIENGQNIQVTNDNRKNYVSLYVNYKLRYSVIDQINAFCNAFDEIIPPELINMFSPSELDLLICGVPHIDLEDLRKHTHYQSPYHNKHPTINLFFNVLKKFTQEDLAKFLVFLTGSSQIPIGGFKIFEENGKPINIIYNNDLNRLPVAHTCFRALDLPCYDDENILKNKLLKAINECDDFGLV